MTVNNFRKSCRDEEVVTLAKSLIKGWKKLLPESGSQSQSQSQSDSLKRSNSTASSGSPETPQEEKEQPKSPETVPQQTTFPAKAAATADSIRLKCRELLTKALKTGDG